MDSNRKVEGDAVKNDVATFTLEERKTIVSVVNDSIMFSIALVFLVVAGLLYYAIRSETPGNIALGILAVIIGAIIAFKEFKMRLKE